MSGADDAGRPVSEAEVVVPPYDADALWSQASIVSGYGVKGRPATDLVHVVNADLLKLDTLAHGPFAADGEDGVLFAEVPAELRARIKRLREDLEFAHSIAEREWHSQAEIGSLTRALAAMEAENQRLLAQVAALTTALDATADVLAATEVELSDARVALQGMADLFEPEKWASGEATLPDIAQATAVARRALAAQPATHRDGLCKAAQKKCEHLAR